MPSQTTSRETASEDESGPGSRAEAEPPEPASASDPSGGEGAPACCQVTVHGAGSDRSGAPVVNHDLLRTRLEQAAALMKKSVAFVRVRIVNDPEMSRLHERYRDQPGPTDVLTFPHASEHEPIDVDIAICIEEASRQASRREIAVADELLLYALHGLLHCAGFDDRNPAAARAMHEEEDRILESIGVGAVFAHPERDEA